ncbi:MAG: sugar ABC transporter permease, partial [Anaerolinea sp.]|nr:sugar ABC transporter permease [Anaerolinea sp.]
MTHIRDYPTVRARQIKLPEPRRLLGYALRYAVALILILFAVIPALWVVSASLNPAKSLIGGTFFPQNPGLSNYQELVTNEFFPYLTWLLNSIKIATITTILTVFLTCLAGYTLSRFRFKGRRAFMTAILVLNVFPSILAMVAIFSMLQQLGLYVEALGLDT